MQFLRNLRHPGYRRSVVLRRLLALSLAFLGIVLAVQERVQHTSTVVIATSIIEPGSAIQASALRTRDIPAALVPEQAVQAPSEVVGKISSALISPGSIVTSHNVVSAELAQRLVADSTDNPLSETANIVPLQLADPSLSSLLFPGDTVTVVSIDRQSNEERIIAQGGRVIYASHEGQDSAVAQPGTVLIALPETLAQQVAATALHSPMAVVLTGERAQIHKDS